MKKYGKLLGFLFIVLASCFITTNVYAAIDQNYPSDAQADWKLHFEGGDDDDPTLATLKTSLPTAVNASSEMVTSEDAFAEFTGTITTTFTGTGDIADYDGKSVTFSYDAGNKSDPNVDDYIYYVVLVPVANPTTQYVYTGTLTAGQIAYGPLPLGTDADGVQYKLYTFSYPKLLTKLDATTLPTKTTYTEGDTFDPAGLIVKATIGSDEIALNGGKTKNEVELDDTDYTYKIDGGAVANDGALTTGEHTVTISYKDGDITKTTDFKIKVEAKAVNPTNPETPTTGSVENPNTGDNVITYIAIATASLLLIGTTVYIFKKVNA